VYRGQKELSQLLLGKRRGIRALCDCEWVSLGARTRGMCDIWERYPDTGVGKRQDAALRAGGDLSKKMGQT